MPKAKWEMIADLMYDYFQLEENFSRKDIEDVVVAYNLSNGTIRANTWKALFILFIEVSVILTDNSCPTCLTLFAVCCACI